MLKCLEMSRANGRTTLKRITKQTAVYFVQKRGAGRGVAFSKLFESLLGASNILCFMEQNSHLCDALSDALFFPSRIFLLFRLSDTSGRYLGQLSSGIKRALDLCLLSMIGPLAHFAPKVLKTSTVFLQRWRAHAHKRRFNFV